MKKATIILSLLLLFIFIFSLSACKIDGYDWQITYNDMGFRLATYESENGKEYYYIAGCLEDNTVQNYFMPMFVNGFPVRSFGWTGWASPIYMDLYDFALQKLYIPGTIIKQNNTYFDDVYKDLQIYYCGEVIDLYEIYPDDLDSAIFDYYVPAEKFNDFQQVFKEGKTTSFGLYKANIAYRLNSEDMCEYYYVDNIEAGSKIENIPPEPTRAGYKFGGWYTEKECVNKWNFDNVPTVSNDDESFVEFALYAKWTKK